jgi:hypothetical protein
MFTGEDASEDPAGVQAGASSAGYGSTWAQRKQVTLQQRGRSGKKSNMGTDSNICVSIRPVRGEVAQFTQQGVLLSDGQHLPADLVLYCTGYTKSYDYLDGGVKVGDPKTVSLLAVCARPAPAYRHEQTLQQPCQDWPVLLTVV